MAGTEVAPGIQRMTNGVVNWYLLESDDGLYLVDAGFPGDWNRLSETLQAIGRPFADIRAVLITHAHIDHLGFADRARREIGATVAVPQDDAELARNPLKPAKSERNPLIYLLRYGPARKLYFTGLRENAIRAKLVGEFRTYTGGEVLPGGLRALGTPGHTFGHCSLLLADRSVLFTGDALVTRDPYTGRLGPCLVARAATADVAQNLRSLDEIAKTGAQLLLPGHGEPWNGGAQAAVEIARSAGAA